MCHTPKYTIEYIKNVDLYTRLLFYQYQVSFEPLNYTTVDDEVNLPDYD